MSAGQAPFTFHTPCSILVAGPSGSGKTEFVTDLILHNLDLFTQKPHTIHYAYGSWQAGFLPLKKRGVKFSEGVPTEEDLDKWFPQGKGGMLVMDDLMAEGGNAQTVVDILTKHSHHCNITVLYLCQDLFLTGKFAKTINRNVHYIVAFKNPRDSLGLRTMLLQAFPGQWREALECYKEATGRPFGYAVFDFHPRSADDSKRIFSHLLKREGYTRVYPLDG